MAKLITVVIVEDAKDIRESLETLINSDPELSCIGCYEHAEAAIQAIPASLPEVVLMDINLPGINGVEAVRQLKQILPDIHFLMCTVFKDDENIFQSLRAGASGYILKSSSSSKILEAIKEVVAGGAPMSATIAKQVIHSFHSLPTKDTSKHMGLTTREIEILQLLSRGLLCKEVASQLDLKVQTIRNHCANIYEKLQVNTRLEAINIVFGKNR